ncbi:hypothetical protein ACFWWT_04200 [Streptomyces sp. NPDC058676]|uniref:hypothetical protein n=1 Tax=Streptomyces sp. NPDC058676 TaxID=3346593 RepID=UPI00364AF939
MRITRLTPEQAQAVGQQLARIGAIFRRIVDALLEFARRLAQDLKPLARFAEQLRPALTRRDRPAWVSPYGPPPRRH